MVKHSRTVTSKLKPEDPHPETGVCNFCGRAFEVKRSSRYLAPHVCPKCRQSRSVRWAVQFRPEEGSGLKSAYTRLFLAIKKAAEDDGKLDSWKQYWVESPQMKRIWDLLARETHQQKILGSVDRPGNMSYI